MGKKSLLEDESLPKADVFKYVGFLFIWDEINTLSAVIKADLAISCAFM